jgi:tetratricopeptide (TPR) repeat protein
MKPNPFVSFLVFFSAVSISAQTISKYPDPPVSLAELSKAPFCPQEEVSQLNASLKADPKNTDLLLRRAVCFKYEKNPAYLDDFSAILALNPVLPKNVKDYADFMVDSKSPEETQKNLDFLLSANPNHWYPYQKRFEFKSRQKDFQGAVADLAKLIELDKTGNFDGWQRIYTLRINSNHPTVFDLYELIFNTARKKQQELSAKLKNLSPDSEQYKQTRQGIENAGDLLSSVCFNWAQTGIKQKNPQVEAAALEKLMQNDVSWQVYKFRSYYYQSKGISDKAFSDEVNYLLLHSEWLKVTLKYLNSEKEQANLKNKIGSLFYRLGDLYFKNQQYVKAIDNFEKAKPYFTNNNSLDYLIKTAMQRLNVTVEPANINLRPSN